MFSTCQRKRKEWKSHALHVRAQDTSIRSLNSRRKTCLIYVLLRESKIFAYTTRRQQKGNSNRVVQNGPLRFAEAEHPFSEGAIPFRSVSLAGRATNSPVRGRRHLRHCCLDTEREGRTPREGDVNIDPTDAIEARVMTVCSALHAGCRSLRSCAKTPAASPSVMRRHPRTTSSPRERSVSLPQRGASLCGGVACQRMSQRGAVRRREWRRHAKRGR